jgi:hypothetical protein
MNAKYLLPLFIVLLFSLTSCKKLISSPITGRWQETKLRIYMVDNTNRILYDTTYLHPFTSLDYAQFNTNGTCEIGTDHYYYLNSPGSPKTPQQIEPIIATWKYAAVGSKFVLAPLTTVTNPGGFNVRDTVSVSDSNNLFIHSVFYSNIGNAKSISEAYFNR